MGHVPGRALPPHRHHRGTRPGQFDRVGVGRDDGAENYFAGAIDDVSVTGGGIDYAADFEENRAGWFQPRTEKDNPLTECWLVENRQAIGFDASLHGEGLVVYHVDDDVMASSLKNTGGSSGANTRGIVIEEADGRFDLIRPTGNRGDSGDVWAPTGAASVFASDLDHDGDVDVLGADVRIGGPDGLHHQ